jgi:hypothetical protein
MRMQWIAVAALAVSPAWMLAADGTFDKTLHVSGTPTLSVNTGSGYVHVSPGSDNEIHIIGHVHANRWGGMDFGSPEDRVKEVVANPPIEQNGNVVTVGKHTSYHNVSIDYEVTTPKGTNLEANSGSGDLRISDLGGSLKANIRLKGVNGGLFAETGSGDIEIDGQPGSAWKLETGSGSVTLNTGGGAKFSLDATTGSGSIHSDPPISVHGSLERHHILGDVNGGGVTVRVETGSGDVRIH